MKKFGLLKLFNGGNSTISEYTTTRMYADPYIKYIGKKSSHKLRTRYFLTNNKKKCLIVV
jgi:hypothetical protein